MRFSAICKMPSVVNNIHESCFRSYQILEYVKGALAKGYQSDTLLDLIETAETAFTDQERKEFSVKRESDELLLAIHKNQAQQCN